jgi:hypothetical protein
MMDRWALGGRPVEKKRRPKTCVSSFLFWALPSFSPPFARLKPERARGEARLIRR